MALTPAQNELINLLNGPSDVAVADFLTLERNKRHMEPFLKRLDGRLQYDVLVDVLRRGTPKDIDDARDFIGACIDCHLDKIPADRVRLPAKLRRKVAKNEGNAELLLFAHTVGNGLRNIASLHPTRMAVGTGQVIFKAPAELTAGLLGRAGYVRKERQWITASAIIPVVAAQAFNMMVATNDAKAALQPTGERFSASEIDKTPRVRTHGSALAYETPGNQESLTSLINRSVQDALDFKTDNLAPNDTYYLSPYLLAKIRDGDTNALKYTKICFEAAQAHGLNPVLFTNQIFRESVHFNPDVINGTKLSAKGAVGISQFMPSTAEEYGLTLDDLKNNPRKSLFAAAEMMAEKTKQFGGDQLLALAAYNGGDEAVRWVQRELGRNNITHQDWLAFMERKRETDPSSKPHAYQNETYSYIRDISNIGWDTKYMSWAQKLHFGALPQGSGFIAQAVGGGQITDRRLPSERPPRLDNNG